MMSDATTVDKTMVDPQSGKLVLLIAETRPWESADMHRQLAAKVKTYVRFIRSPEFVKEHNRPPEDAVVRLVTMQQPDEATLTYCTRVRYELKKHGVAFEVRVLGGAAPAPSAAPGAPAPAAPEPPPSIPPPTEPEEPSLVEGYAGTAEHADTEEYAETEEYADTEEYTEAAEVTDVEDYALSEDTEIEFLSGSEHADVEEPVGGDAVDQATFLPEEELGPRGTGSGTAKESIGIAKRKSHIDLSTGTGTGSLYALESEALGPPNFGGALAAAISSAIAGGLLWLALSALSHQPGSPLALAVGVMVGMSVRARGAGKTTEFRIIGLLGTALGCLIGSVLGAAVVIASTEGVPFAELLGGVGAIQDTMGKAYGLPSLPLFAMALYLGYRLAVPKEREQDSP